MFSACIFCHASLGSNEMIEHFPVGQRLAFDAEKGRLWVVCTSCARWNLTPLDVRWEAIEECERIFRAGKLRVSTDQIGLARARDGTTLVRVGRPLRPEMAAWRYGDQFGQRRRRHIAIATATALGAGGMLIVGPVAGLVTWSTAFTSFNFLQSLHDMRSAAHVAMNGRIVRLSKLQLSCVTIRPDVGHGFSIAIPYDPIRTRMERVKRVFAAAPTDKPLLLQGGEAVRAVRQLLPRINKSGGRSREIGAAVALLEDGRDVDRMFSDAARTPFESLPLMKRPLGRGLRSDPSAALASLPAPVRLALEMTIHETDERRALEGELRALEERWREAEEIAAIADDLFVPHPVREALSRLRG